MGFPSAPLWYVLYPDASIAESLLFVKPTAPSSILKGYIMLQFSNMVENND